MAQQQQTQEPAAGDQRPSSPEPQSWLERQVERLRPIYLAQGPIAIRFEDDGSAVLVRGADERDLVSVALSTAAVEVQGAPSLGNASQAIVQLALWASWLRARSTRVGTLRWIVRHANSIATSRLTAAVQSQLTRAGLIEPSRLWGVDATACRGLDVWAACELDRRGVL